MSHKPNVASSCVDFIFFLVERDGVLRERVLAKAKEYYTAGKALRDQVVALNNSTGATPQTQATKVISEANVREPPFSSSSSSSFLLFFYYFFPFLLAVFV